MLFGCFTASPTGPGTLAPCTRQVGKYQEQPQLLDPLLEGLVGPLTALLRAAAEDPGAADLRRVRGVARLLWQLSVVRRVPAGRAGWDTIKASCRCTPPLPLPVEAPPLAEPVTHTRRMPRCTRPHTLQGLQDCASLLPK